MATLNVYGVLKSIETGRGLAGLTVQLYSRHIGGGSVEALGIVRISKADGSFQAIVDSETISSFYSGGEAIQIGFKVLDGAVELQQPETSFVWVEGVESFILPITDGWSSTDIAYNIGGYVRGIAGNGLPKLAVALYTRHINGDPIEAVGLTTVTSDNGFFQFITNDAALRSFFDADEPIQLGFEVRDTDILITPAGSVVWTVGQSEPVEIVVDLQEHPTADIFTVTSFGSVQYTNGASGEGLQVKVYGVKFRNNTLLGSTIVDINGNYKVTVSSDLFGDTPVSRRKLIIAVYDVSDAMIKSSGIIDVSDNLNIDFAIDSSTDEPIVFDDILNRVNSEIINPDTPTPPIHTLTTEDVSYLSLVLDMPVQRIEDFVSVHKYANEMSIVTPSLVQAVAPIGGLARNPVLNMGEQEMRDAIQKAIDDKQIPIASPTDVDNFIAASNTKKIEDTLSIPISNESFSFAEVLSPVFGADDAKRLAFLELYNNENTATPAAFWTAYETAVGTTEMNDVKKGMTLVSLSGFQPEIVEGLLPEVDGDVNIRKLATWTEANWKNKIDDVCTAANRLCVPVAIRGTSTDVGDDVAKTIYANRLKQVVQDLYPMGNIQGNLEGPSGSILIPDTGRRDEVITFLENNPDFDVRIDSMHNINGTDYNLAGITDLPQLKDDIEPYQRLLRATGGRPEAVIAFKLDELNSASDISSMGFDQFVEAYATVIGSAEDAANIYARAQAIDNTTTEITLNFRQQFNFLDGSTVNDSVGDATLLPFYDPIPSDPNLVTLFGNMDYCTCKECMSLYSPGAYYTDLLRFLQVNTSKNTNDGVYNEMIRRRPDLLHIDLSCKNANTAMPHIDIVNELLENYIKDPTLSTTPASYQTQGTTAQIGAYPEHIIKDAGVYKQYKGYETVYNTTLNSAVHPLVLPFSLPLEETRTYLNFFGQSRYELMNLYKPYGTIPANGISDSALYAELLNISFETKKIITNTHTLSASPWLFYGIKAAVTTSSNGLPDPADSGNVIHGDWIEDILAERLDILCNQLGISYRDFLQLMVTDFLNKKIAGERKILIVVDVKTPPIDEDTCVIRDLHLHFDGSVNQVDFFTKLYRFVRLYRAYAGSIYELDTILRVAGITDLTEASFAIFGKIISTANILRIRPDYLAMWWNKIDTTRYINYNTESQDEVPSLYDQIFRNKSVINAPISDFDDPNSLPSSYTGRTALIAAFCRLKEDEVISILGFLDVSLSNAITLTALSRIYIFGAVAASQNISIRELLDLFYILKFKTLSPLYNPLTSDYNLTSDATTLGFLSILTDTVGLMFKTAFTVDDINYVARDLDKFDNYKPQDVEIKNFYEALRKELKKFPIYVAPPPADDGLLNKLTNVIYQHFGAEFSLPTGWIETMLSTMLPASGGGLNIVRCLIAEPFIISNVELLENTIVDTFAVADLYKAYRLITKVSFLLEKWAMTSEAYTYLYKSANIDLLSFNFAGLPVTSSVTQNDTNTVFNGLLRVGLWVSVRDNLALTADGFINLLKSTIPIKGGSKANWISALTNATDWGTQLTDLVGLAATSVDAGILAVSYDADFRADNIKGARLIDRIIGIMNWGTRIGLNPATMYAVLKTSPILDDSQKILLAVKGKYDETGWLEIAKPLRDKLRIKQRDALVAYAVSNPNESDPGNRKRWRSENELYAYFLIDTQMQPMVMTSRIKQAISAVQLFVDRVLLGIEYPNYTYGTKLTVKENIVKQWEQWRKWYRIWEANRKIFLYPENWIEPELRDDKSPFFEELYTELIQDEFTNDRAEEAFRNYLGKLNGVARLEPAGSCYDGAGIVHVFGRTYGAPHTYYYRRLQNNEWTAWELVDLEIEGDHIVPIVWGNRLYIYWLTYIDKISGLPEGDHFGHSPWFYNSRANASVGASEQFPNRQLLVEASINWSEYKNKKWFKHSVSDDKAILKLDPSVEAYVNIGFQSSDYNTRNYFNVITNNGENNVTDTLKSKLFLFPYIHEPEKDNMLTLWIMNPMQDPGDNYQFITGYKFIDNNSQPEVIRTWAYEWNFPSPEFTLVKNMKFNQRPYDTGGTGLTSNMIVDKHPNYSPVLYSYYNQGIFSTPFKYNGPRTTILSSTGVYGNFKIRAKSNFVSHPLENEFLYEDDRNTFFVRFVDVPIIAQPGGNGTVTPSTGSPVTGAPTNWSSSSTPSTAAALLSYQNNLTLDTVNAVAMDVYPTAPNASISPYAQSPGYIQPMASQNSATSKLKESISLRYFQTFYHPHVNTFVSALNAKGIDGLLTLQIQDTTDTMNFNGQYQPTSVVANRIGTQYVYPTNKVDFDYWGAYSVYNWELFFHTPMMIAQRLSENQKFAEARKWYHYIFDPTSNVDDAGVETTEKKRFWRFRPFYTLSGAPVQTLAELLASINSQGYAQVKNWENNPFKPHMIARQRNVAYMKTVVMKYLDNLIAWGDQLFRQDTIESINEATQLYILAANILGRRPQDVPSRVAFSAKTYDELNSTGTIDVFSNAKVKLESYLAPNGSVNSAGVSTGTNPLNGKSVFYFCLTRNDKLMGYWDTVADRLFKIRNSMNLQGITRQLPLFEAPIDPAMLVKAAAAGIDTASVMNDASSAPSHYRFTYILQKANELCGDVRGLGNSLLGALEKKDAEALALLRSSQEMSVQDKMKAVKLTQIDEIKANIQALEHSKEVINTRIQYYSTRKYTNKKEDEQISLLRASIPLHTKQANRQALASAAAIIPTFSVQAPFALGPSFGGGNLSSKISAFSAKIGAEIAINGAKGSMAQAMGGYDRRQEEWNFQLSVSQKDLEQVDKQILSAQLRLLVAEKELSTQELQIENARAVDEYMRSKYTNEQLYSWMIAQITTTYFQSYQMAYDMAKRAERCFNFELPLATKATDGYIKFGYWDSLKKGLLCADKLQYDLRKLEVSYIENNVRELELTKNVSLASLDAKALVELITTGTCEFFVSEEHFNLDFPGHYFRRLKTVSLSIPCIAGPYTTISCQVVLTKNAIRSSTTGELTEVGGVAPMIATSSAQNDSGLFEVNFKDERYLPFEGKGAVSEWKLTIKTGTQVALFDLSTISDVILHLKYTARDGGEGYRNTIIGEVNGLLASVVAENSLSASKLPRYFSLKHEYATEWGNYLSDHELDISWSHDDFPFFMKGKTIKVTGVVAYGIKDGKVVSSHIPVLPSPSYPYKLIDTTAGISADFGVLQSSGISLQILPNSSNNLAFKIQLNSGNVDINTVFDDIMLVAFYQA